MRAAALSAAMLLFAASAHGAEAIEGRVAWVDAGGKALLLTTRTASGDYDDVKLVLGDRTARLGEPPLARPREGMWISAEIERAEADRSPGTFTAISLRQIPPLDRPDSPLPQAQ